MLLSTQFNGKYEHYLQSNSALAIQAPKWGSGQPNQRRLEVSTVMLTLTLFSYQYRYLKCSWCGPLKNFQGGEL
jgi:hypothetical protein